VISNPIDLGVFQQPERAQATESLKLPQNMKYILAGFASNTEKRKGIDLLLESISWLLDNNPHSQKGTCILVVGKKPESVAFDPRVQWRFLGNVSSDETMAKVYSASDLFALPSIEDNLPKHDA
jgi:glycosyltransferase involved in cell wall biosynthesis